MYFGFKTLVNNKIIKRVVKNKHKYIIMSNIIIKLKLVQYMIKTYSLVPNSNYKIIYRLIQNT